VDCEADSSADGALRCDSAMRASTFWAENAVVPGSGCAHCDVVKARQQSWLQHLVARIAGCVDSATAESWQRCAMRMQQAWGGAAVAASASGTNTPTSANNRRNLAVRRCMFFV